MPGGVPLAPYAVRPGRGRGRLIDEPPAPTRNEYQRDRDRVVHSNAFRRLEYKTQVFLNHEGDLFRTRLTHSIEVAQIARSIARALRLNEDLTEAIALAHDLGHTPFGHSGQDALNECMKHHGGFEHNLQSLRVVDELEQRYAAFDGLNLCFETREGILKHCSRVNAAALGEVGERFLADRRPSLEAQVANLADEIAYNNHDIDDGLRSGLITLAQLADVELFDVRARQVRAEYPHLPDRRIVSETIRRLINDLVLDLLAHSARQIGAQALPDVEAVRRAPALIGFSDPVRQQATALKRFLFSHLYRHPQVLARMDQAKRVVHDLFGALSGDPGLLPVDHRIRHQRIGVRAVADYLAGMTDRYALQAHRRLTGESLHW
ncbi:MAG: deoxyguanosinetriphosphate triphosphohydrolase [Burkholderiaceae bacterium]